MRTPASTSLLLVVALAACSDRNAAAGEVLTTSRPVVVHTVTEEPLAPAIVATGVIAGKEEIPLSFKVGGVIARLTVDAGDRVRAGQVLAELSQTEIAALATKASEARAKAQRDVDRVRALHADSVATLTQLQDATTALQVAEQDVRAVEFNRSHAIIRAPADGVILERNAEPGALLNPGSTVVTLRTERRGVVLRAGLADRDVMRVRQGDRARISLDALPGSAIEGRVSQIAAAASPHTGTFNVEISISRAPRPLASGLIARAEIAVASAGTYPMLPLEAVVEASADSAIVFVIPAGTDVAERRMIRLAQIEGPHAAVASGLRAGEQVVVRGGAYLQDGGRVSVTGGREER